MSETDRITRTLSSIERNLAVIVQDVREIKHILGIPVRQEAASRAEILAEGNGQGPPADRSLAAVPTLRRSQDHPGLGAQEARQAGHSWPRSWT
jgi:hypothetical protein